MAKVLLAYATTDGLTGRVAARLAERMGSRGHDLDVVDVGRDAAPDPAAYDAVVLGGSIHLGAWQRELTGFAHAHESALRARPCALFVVCLAACEHGPAARREAEGYLELFKRNTALEPRPTRAIAGELAYTRYGTVKRFAMKQIARVKGLSTDVSRDHEYTRWDEVEAFGDELAGFASAAEATSRV